MPLMGAVGMAVDYTRVNAARTAFQVALDSTALMMSKDAATLTDEQRKTEATKTFGALFNRPEVTDATVTPVFTTAGGSKLTLNGSAVVHTNFLGVIGISEVNISAMSVSTWGNTRLRVALVLDNTGSMASDEKIDALKTASHNLLSQLQSAAVRPEDVYVSIVPFSKGVNFGADNHAASWLRWDLWDAVNAAEQYSSRPQGVKPLSYDWTGMNTLVDNMSPAGNTNQAIGLQVGWLSLVGGGPFPVVPKVPLYQYTDVIILLTGGLNTQNRWTSTQDDICANIKLAIVELYTIQVNTGGDPTSTMLQTCASSTDKFYLLTAADQMTATFNTIGTNLTKLRVAQ
ncbi:MAG: VWA domain-containing protein [Pseudolabrys sp.]